MPELLPIMGGCWGSRGSNKHLGVSLNRAHLRRPDVNRIQSLGRRPLTSCLETAQNSRGSREKRISQERGGSYASGKCGNRLGFELLAKLKTGNGQSDLDGSLQQFPNTRPNTITIMRHLPSRLTLTIPPKDETAPLLGIKC